MALREEAARILPAVNPTLPSLRRRFAARDLERVEAFVAILNGEREASIADPGQRPTAFFFPGLGAQPWHDPTHFPWVARIEAAYAEVRGELMALLAGVPLEPYRRFASGDLLNTKWKGYFFHRWGQRFEENRARCPATARLLDGLPVTYEGLFSILHGGGHIPAHTGMFNAILACHLGVLVPPGCEMRVGDEVRTWQEGKCLVFDDTYEHEVWNRSSVLRVILFTGTWHPELTPIEITCLDAFFERAAELGLT